MRSRLAVLRRLLVRLGPSSAAFYEKSFFLRESTFSLAFATRSSLRAARAQTRCTQRHDLLEPLRPIFYLRSTLPAVADLLDVLTQLPSDSAAVLN